MNGKDVREWMTVAFAGVALIVSGGSFLYTKDSVAQAKNQYDQAAQQFEDSGPKLSITDLRVKVWNSSKDVWSDEIEKGTSLSYAQIEAPNQPYLIFTVLSSGRTTAELRDVGIGTSENDYVTASYALCRAKSKDRDSKLERCSFPLELRAGRSQNIYLALDRVDKSRLTCNSYVEQNGLEAVALRTDETKSAKPSGVSIALASYCATIPQETPQ